MVPIAHGGYAVAFRASIVNANVSSLNNINFSMMEDPDDDNIVWMQNGEPSSLYCDDETDGELIRGLHAGQRVPAGLRNRRHGGRSRLWRRATKPATMLLTWTFHLRPGVTFTDGTPLTANDVVMSYAVRVGRCQPAPRGAHRHVRLLVVVLHRLLECASVVNTRGFSLSEEGHGERHAPLTDRPVILLTVDFALCFLS